MDALTHKPHSDRKPAKESHYLPLLMALKNEPGLYAVTVAHDEWCDLLLNGGLCNCEPFVLAQEIAPC